MTESEPMQFQQREIGGASIELIDDGRGPAILLLHGAGGLDAKAPFLPPLAEGHRLVAPVHPGFGNSSRPDSIDTVDDLAYFYLDFLDELDLDKVVLIGCSFGGWIAAELATRCAHRLEKLVLVGAVGIRPGTRTDRPILDVFGVPPTVLNAAMYADPERNAPVLSTYSDEEFLKLARNQEALALYSWRPYMHNPRLLSRLHRITIPTLVIWGEKDGIVSTDYGQTYADAIHGSKFAVISDAGHVPHLEQTAEFVKLVLEFAGQ